MLLEFYTGDALFQTHDNLEHLAMMEKILGKIPKTLLRSEASKQYFDNGAVKFPSRLTTEKSENKVKQLKKFEVFFFFFLSFFFLLFYPLFSFLSFLVI